MTDAYGANDALRHKNLLDRMSRSTPSCKEFHFRQYANSRDPMNEPGQPLFNTSALGFRQQAHFK